MFGDEPRMKNIMYEDTKTTLDHITGEVVSTTSDKRVRLPQTDDFVMTFTRYLGFLKNISGGASKLLFGLIGVVDRNNEITLNSARKRKIAEMAGLKEKSIDSLLTQLKKKEIIIQVDRGIYQLNPYLFGKGKFKNINKLRMSIEFDFKTQTKKLEYEHEYGVDEEEVNLFDLEDMEEVKANLMERLDSKDDE